MAAPPPFPPLKPKKRKLYLKPLKKPLPVSGLGLPPELPCPRTIEVRPWDPNTKPTRYNDPNPGKSLSSIEQCRLITRLFSEHRDFVRRTVERHGVPSRDADDITQEVFAIALQRIEDYDAASSARPWLFVMAIQRAANYRRLARNRIEPVLAVPAPEPADVTDLESALLASEERTLIRELIGRLSPKLRVMLIMHDLEERPMADIVAELGIPLKTGHARLKLAREEVLRRGQAVALTRESLPLSVRNLVRIREVLLSYGQDPQAHKRAALVAQRKAPSAPLTYLVFA